MKNTLSEIAALIHDSQRIAIFGHKDGDSDCYGSMFALADALIAGGRHCVVVMDEDFPTNLDFLLSNFDGEIVSSLDDNQYLNIFLDTSDIARLSATKEATKQERSNNKVVHLDHHTKGDLEDISTLSYRNENACSTAEIIYNLLLELDLPLNKEISTCLLAGIIADTNSFENQNTNKECFDIASKLLAKGARLKIINQHLFGGKAVNSLKIWGLAMERLTFNNRLGVVYTYLTNADINSCGLSGEAISGIVNFLNQIAGARIVILFTEEVAGQVKVSFRTRDDSVNVAKLARQLGGGGHVKAAGVTFPGRIRSEHGQIRIG